MERLDSLIIMMRSNKLRNLTIMFFTSITSVQWLTANTFFAKLCVKCFSFTNRLFEDSCADTRNNEISKDRGS